MEKRELKKKVRGRLKGYGGISLKVVGCRIVYNYPSNKTYHFQIWFLMPYAPNFFLSEILRLLSFSVCR